MVAIRGPVADGQHSTRRTSCVEDVGIQVVLVAQVEDGHALQQVPASDVELLFRGEPPAVRHGHLLEVRNILLAGPEMSSSVSSRAGRLTPPET